MVVDPFCVGEVQTYTAVGGRCAHRAVHNIRHGTGRVDLRMEEIIAVDSCKVPAVISVFRFESQTSVFRCVNASWCFCAGRADHTGIGLDPFPDTLVILFENVNLTLAAVQKNLILCRALVVHGSLRDGKTLFGDLEADLCPVFAVPCGYPDHGFTGSFAGDDRSGDAVKQLYNNVKGTPAFFFGTGKTTNFLKISEGEASLLMAIVQYGLLFVLLYIFVFAIYGWRYKSNLITYFLFLFVFLGCIYQRPFLFQPEYLFFYSLMAMSCGDLMEEKHIKEKKKINKTS